MVSEKDYFEPYFTDPVDRSHLDFIDILYEYGFNHVNYKAYLDVNNPVVRYASLGEAIKATGAWAWQQLFDIGFTGVNPEDAPDQQILTAMSNVAKARDKADLEPVISFASVMFFAIGSSAKRDVSDDDIRTMAMPFDLALRNRLRQITDNEAYEQDVETESVALINYVSVSFFSRQIWSEPQFDEQDFLDGISHLLESFADKWGKS